jgi:GH25 family lysozyme M1 (1,4-beta-N-acetylmuramidase)
MLHNVKSEKDAALSDAALAANGWIRAEHVQGALDEFDLSTEILSRVFPNKVVYKVDGFTHYDDIDTSLPQHKYNWDALRWQEGRPVYTAEDGTVALLGVDVSHHQKKIDWQRVKADGIDFAMIRVGYRGSEQGTIQEDGYYRENLAGALGAGIEIGAYFFSQATSEAEAIEEAEYVIGALAGSEVTMPVVFDIEEVSGSESRMNDLTSDQVTSLAKAFCDRISEAGYRPMIYANTIWFMARMNLKDLTNYPKWLAQYYESYPAYPYDFEMWQYTESGKVDGIKGNTDMNLAFRRG